MPCCERVVRKADGWMPLLIPGSIRSTSPPRWPSCASFAEEAGRDPASLPIHGRVYLGPGWQAEVEQAIAARLQRLAASASTGSLSRACSHAQHLDAIIAVKSEIDALVG